MTEHMQRYLIERNIPGAAKMSPQQLREAAAHSNKVLADIGDGIRWDHSYVAGDKLYCVYEAKDEALIRRHAEQSGFPANTITPLATVIGPDTAAAD